MLANLDIWLTFEGPQQMSSWRHEGPKLDSGHATCVEQFGSARVRRRYTVPQLWSCEQQDVGWMLLAWLSSGECPGNIESNGS